MRNLHDGMQKENHVSTKAMIAFMIVMGAVLLLFLSIMGISVFYYGERLVREGLIVILLVCLIGGVTLALVGANVLNRKKKEQVAQMDPPGMHDEKAANQVRETSDTAKKAACFLKKRKIILHMVMAAVLFEMIIYLLGCGAGLANIQPLVLVKYAIPFFFIRMAEMKPEIGGGVLLGCCFIHLTTVMQIVQIRLVDMWMVSPYIALQAVGRYAWLLLMLAAGIWLMLPKNRDLAMTL